MSCFSVGSSNSSCGSELSLCHPRGFGQGTLPGFLFISNPSLSFAKQLHALGSAPSCPLELPSFQGSTNLLKYLRLASQQMGPAVTQAMIKIFSKCAEENNLLLLSPSGGNCCLGGLSCALMLAVPALSTDSGFEHLHPCAYWLFPLFSPHLFSILSHRRFPAFFS